MTTADVTDFIKTVSANCENITQMKAQTKSSIKECWKKAARELPKEKRQAVLDASRKGGVMVGEIMKNCDVTLEEYLGIIELNTRVIKYSVLNTETV